MRVHSKRLSGTQFIPVNVFEGELPLMLFSLLLGSKSLVLSRRRPRARGNLQLVTSMAPGQWRWQLNDDALTLMIYSGPNQVLGQLLIDWLQPRTCNKHQAGTLWPDSHTNGFYFTECSSRYSKCWRAAVIRPVGWETARCLLIGQTAVVLIHVNFHDSLIVLILHVPLCEMLLQGSSLGSIILISNSCCTRAFRSIRHIWAFANVFVSLSDPGALKLHFWPHQHCSRSLWSLTFWSAAETKW